jgi:hypothetical protein
MPAVSSRMLVSWPAAPANRFLEQPWTGYHVALIARNPEHLKKTAEDIKSSGGDVSGDTNIRICLAVLM